MTNSDFRAICAELVDAYEHELNKRGMGCDLINRARALLDQPVAEEPTDEELLRVAATAIDPYESSDIALGEYEPETECAVEVYGSELIAYARAVLARWGYPTPQPVAVSERLPGPDDCLDEGWAWFFNQRIGWRQAVLPVSTGYTHWLPANALPTPEA